MLTSHRILQQYWHDGRYDPRQVREDTAGQFFSSLIFCHVTGIKRSRSRQNRPALAPAGVGIVVVSPERE